jgi:hypothetical protein
MTTMTPERIPNLVFWCVHVDRRYGCTRGRSSWRLYKARNGRVLAVAEMLISRPSGAHVNRELSPFN